MRAIKIGVDAWFLIRIEDALGVGITGIVFNAAGFTGGNNGVWLSKNAGLGAAIALAAGDWQEVHQGYYMVRISAARNDTLGDGALIVTYLAVDQAREFKVMSNLADDATTAANAAKTSADAATTAATTAATNAANAKTSADAATTAATTAGTKADVAAANALLAMNAALGRGLVRTTFAFSAGTPDLLTLKVRFYDTIVHATTDDGVTGLVVPEFTMTTAYSGTALAGTAHQPTKVTGA